MVEFLTWLENLQFSAWIRESGSIWAYPLVLSLHAMGMSFIVGVSFAVDLRILGFGQGLPLRPFEKFFPYMWLGFWVNTISGVILLIADATTKFANYVFYIKMAFIVVAVWLIGRIRRTVFSHAELVESDHAPGSAKALAALSIFCWLGAITAGRLMAYLGPVSGLTGASGLKK
jgi:hypothetical protein